MLKQKMPNEFWPNIFHRPAVAPKGFFILILLYTVIHQTRSTRIFQTITVFGIFKHHALFERYKNLNNIKRKMVDLPILKNS